MTLITAVITDPSTMEKDPASYARLLGSSSDSSVFMTMEWQGAWWKHYGMTRRLHAIRVTENDRLVGYGPFMTTRFGRLLKATKLEFVGAGLSDRLGIIAENDRNEVIGAVLDAVTDNLTWEVGELRDIRQDGPTAKCALERFPQAEVSKEDSPCIRVRPSFQDYLLTLSQNSRHNMIRAYRRNSDELKAEAFRITDPDLLPGALEEFFRLHQMRWSDKGKRSVLTPDMRDFLRDAVMRLATPGNSVIHALRIGEKTISTCLGFEYQNCYLYYLSGLDPAYTKQAPGRLLLSMIIEEAHKRGLKEVDLLRGDEEYKYHLGAENRSNIIVKVRGNSFKSGLLEGANHLNVRHGEGS